MSVLKAISISDKKGIRKKNIETVKLVKDFGLENDAHGGKWHRQVSFLAQESIDFMVEKGLDVVAGNFAENLTTEGLTLTELTVGTHISIGKAELVISQLGKICHTRCAIYHQAGDCVMPREGIFAVVLKGADIKVGDSLQVLQNVSKGAAIITTAQHKLKTDDLLSKKARQLFNPVFLRLDIISKKEGGSLTSILADLTDTQKIANIVVYDPSGELGLELAGFPKGSDNPNSYRVKQSNLFHCRSLEDLESINGS